MNILKQNLLRTLVIALASTICSITFAKSTWESVSPDDPNPGTVPDTVIEEVTTLEIENIGGHKVYAGQDKLRSSPYAYINVDFSCDGTAKLFAYPKGKFQGPEDVTQVNYEWKLRDDHARVSMNFIDYTQKQLSLNKNADVKIVPTTGSSLIVGKASIRDLVVSRIVKHKDCNNTEPKVEGLSTAFYKNPGEIPKTIVKELTSLDVRNVGGHKIFAGPDEKFLSHHLYHNVNFNCDGTGSFEAFPPDFPKGSTQAFIIKKELGTFSWVVEKDRFIIITITDYIEGGVVKRKDIDISGTVKDDKSVSVVLGESDIDSRFVSRIVQHTACTKL